MRRLKWFAVVLCLMALAWGFLFPKPRISQATCDRIRVGMTSAEVQALLGERGVCISSLYEIGKPQPTTSKWDGKWGSIYVSFDENHVVTGTQFVPKKQTDPVQDYLDRVLTSLGW
jgi:hypothetical protein